jgi:EF hand
MFISPMGEPFRPNGRDDDGLADWFRQADGNHDGQLTLVEMQQDAERFFGLLDVSRDGEIDPDDVTRYETVVAPEITSGSSFGLMAMEAGEPSEGEGPRGGRGRGHHRGGGGGFFHGADNDQHQGAGRFGLLDLPEPVVSADANFNRGVSLPEFRQAAAQRFMALDLDHHGYLTLAVLETIRPAAPAAPKKPQKPTEPDESALPDQG